MTKTINTTIIQKAGGVPADIMTQDRIQEFKDVLEKQYLELTDDRIQKERVRVLENTQRTVENQIGKLSKIDKNFLNKIQQARTDRSLKQK